MLVDGSEDTLQNAREAQLRDLFRRSLPARLRVILLGWQRLKEGTPGAHEQLFRPVHGLAGTAGTFGFDAVSDPAQEVQRLLSEAGHLKSPAAAFAGEIEAALGKLVAAVEQAVSAPREAPAAGDGGPSPSAGAVVALRERVPGELSRLADDLRVHGYEPVLQDALAPEVPACLAIVCDLSVALEQRAPLEAARAEGANLVLVAALVDPRAQLVAARLRADALLPSAATGTEVAATLDRLRWERAAGSPRLVVVDDEPDRARRVIDELTSLGLEPVACQEPGEALRLLAEGQPDMVLIHVTRPGYTDLELLRAIRCQDDLVDVPVVVMANPGMRCEALRLGADDVLPPDLGTVELAALLHARAARGTRLRRRMSRDVVTGLLNRNAFEERLKGEMARAWRDSATMALAVLDLDHLKAVNDTHGHVAGDRVLAALGRVLRERLRESDIAARIGGDEVALILPGTKVQDAREVVDAIRRRFADEQGVHAGAAGAATVSAGIASYPEFGSPRTLLDAADGALYRAKREGRNRVAVAGHVPHGRILIIDDDEILTELWRSVLEGAGFDTMVAHDGLRGYEMARERAPDLVVCDLLLPHMHGFKLCRRLKRDAATRDIPVVLTTGVFRKYADEVKAKGCGASDFIRKPIDPHEFLTRVTRLLPAAVESGAA